MAKRIDLGITPYGLLSVIDRTNPKSLNMRNRKDFFVLLNPKDDGGINIDLAGHGLYLARVMLGIDMLPIQKYRYEDLEYYIFVFQKTPDAILDGMPLESIAKNNEDLFQSMRIDSDFFKEAVSKSIPYVIRDCFEQAKIDAQRGSLEDVLEKRHKAGALAQTFNLAIDLAPYDALLKEASQSYMRIRPTGPWGLFRDL